jgi:hypothetical protein
VRIQPRQQTLDVWRAVARFSRREDGVPWCWGGLDGRNSISDAEQLLCLLYPAAEVANFSLDSPDETADEVLAALTLLGDNREIPKLLIDVISDYMTSYVSESGTPIFAGGSYFRPKNTAEELSPQQRELDVVDSFATSISLTLATLGFLKVFGRSVRRPELQQKIADLEAITSTRLTAAMIGLLRSFAVNVFKPDSKEGRTLRRTLNQTGSQNDRAVMAELNRRLKPVRASLRDATLGLTQDERLDDENVLFECGFSWGVVRGAPFIETPDPVGPQIAGVALGAPYLYFTLVAIDRIVDLSSVRTRVLGLLNFEQQRLAQALQLRGDLIMGYWSAVARSSSGRWPLEDIPWRTVDDEESDYFTLLVTSVVLQELLTHTATDDDLTRTVAVLEELAVRGRISRRVARADPAIQLHTTGVRLDLDGDTTLGPPMCWQVTDFAALLLKRTVRAAGLSRNIGARERLLAVAEAALDHMWHRRISSGSAAGLWDNPGALFPGVAKDPELPSWYMTERVIECLVVAARTITQSPIISPQLMEITTDLLGEADHLVSQYQLETSDQDGSSMSAVLLRIDTRLQRARDILRERPGTAHALVTDALRDLDELTAARQDAARSV